MDSSQPARKIGERFLPGLLGARSVVGIDRGDADELLEEGNDVLAHGRDHHRSRWRVQGLSPDVARLSQPGVEAPRPAETAGTLSWTPSAVFTVAIRLGRMCERSLRKVSRWLRISR